MGGDFLLFAVVGFLAQLVDGALGMAYGVVSATVLLSVGVSPATASASVHAAEVFTTAASATSHLANRNIDWKLFWLLAPAGIVGGVAGAYLLTGVEGDMARPFVTFYLSLMGVFILYRAFKGVPPHLEPNAKLIAPLGMAGGFVDAAGGGGWGSVVSSTLVGSGGQPRYVIGTVNTVEFFLTVSVSAAFLFALASGHWSEANDLASHAWSVGGLIAGGVLAAPLAGIVVRRVPTRPMMFAVGLLIMALAGFQTWEALG
ncbi:sulfite exporter TauE/SafE family protein [Pelagibacterium xiamenense]|uniref:sulfite exporter TauE/SafE family protein n=1 Tax=Pelagibacterium xiamenense TaxID=2901140 RepID=UPI001E465A1F|nr:sulfite exporter TauE/SafE family protein [Pelagibacterium xiamenense]MCD7059202.1 sulfite exporter TauE/SafE family protein [Pelagibacterium xiamenense]